MPFDLFKELVVNLNLEHNPNDMTATTTTVATKIGWIHQ